MSRVTVKRSITQTKQAGTLAVPWGIRSHSLGTLEVQKALKKVEYQENQSRHRGIRDLIGVGDRNRVNSMTLLSFFIVDCGSNAPGFLRDAYKGASPRARGRLSEAGGKVRDQDGVCLLRV